MKILVSAGVAERMRRLGSWLRRRNSSKDSLAFVADDVALVSVDDAVETTAATRAEVRCPSSGTQAVAWPGKRCQITVALGATGIVAIAKWNTSAARRGRQQPDFRIVVHQSPSDVLPGHQLDEILEHAAIDDASRSAAFVAPQLHRAFVCL